ncbi:unnamed protein product [Clonostachys solani]|uniref:Uncharacterized protein n=1 Tax=Clonostachys solani TaxID=160281 RepID=A0A9N9Z6F5_9HYPO|nr:unnamed protein product [Clonostachys solani]
MDAIQDRTAVNSRLVRYDMGEAEHTRQPNAVVRFRQAKADSKEAKNFSAVPDGTGAGVTFSEAERDITNATSKEVAVVVGELLITAPSGNGIVATQEFTHKVVARIFDARCVLSILVNKVDNLAQLAPLPSNRLDNQIFFYPEFSQGISRTQTTRKITRKMMWKRSITEFKEQIKGTLIDSHRHARHNDEELDSSSSSTETSRATNDIVHLRAIRKHIHNSRNSQLSDTELRKMQLLAVINKIFDMEIQFTLKDAEAASAACIELWKPPKEILFHHTYLFALSAAIYEGALGQYVVHYDDYRVFIGYFCQHIGERSAKIDRVVNDAIVITKLTSGNRTELLEKLSTTFDPMDAGDIIDHIAQRLSLKDGGKSGGKQHSGARAVVESFNDARPVSNSLCPVVLLNWEFEDILFKGLASQGLANDIEEQERCRHHYDALSGVVGCDLFKSSHDGRNSRGEDVTGISVL